MHACARVRACQHNLLLSPQNTQAQKEGKPKPRKQFYLGRSRLGGVLDGGGRQIGGVSGKRLSLRHQHLEFLCKTKL